eukprot:gnl/TRDRNA2_/TRDRNA2_86056_c0_seq2.p1 gnl/TRDRNA2_/TRDRNA2_86056_c0~~gnl/TRDRNA2_/TRDRNA2_86056_c0_seq2.p1  ORF type:complete len:388 (-),score=33.96 gnl/TRDRNA2_/TRDRNA2_86056_c0_seq2:275-1438(-)
MMSVWLFTYVSAVITAINALQLQDIANCSTEHADVNPSSSALAEGSEQPALFKKLGWHPKERERCDPDLPMPPQESPAPGFYSKRIAMVFWKESFRGPNGVAWLMGQDKELIRCTPESEPIQRALSRSHVKQMIEPLEAAGFSVDVILSSRSCGSAGSAERSRLQKSLADVYNEGRSRVVKSSFYEKAVNQFQSSGLAAQAVLDHLKESRAQYESILFWRFDGPAMEPLVSTDFQRTDKRIERNGSAPSIEKLYSRPPARNLSRHYGYPSWAHSHLFITTDGLQTVSVPGWMAACVLPPMVSGCKATPNAKADNFLECFQENSPKKADHSRQAGFPKGPIYRGLAVGSRAPPVGLLALFIWEFSLQRLAISWRSLADRHAWAKTRPK